MPNLEADYMEGLRLFYLQKYDEAAPLLTRTAEAGDAKAQHFLALMYEHGNGVERDLERAAYWYGRTAKAGDKDAQLTYAMLRALGKGVEADIADACHWATRSFHQGNANAIQALQIVRSEASSIAAEAVEAFKAAHRAGDDAGAAAHLERAAECGSADAQFALAQLMYEGRGVEENRDEALFWYGEAAALGHAEARERLNELTAAPGSYRGEEEAAV